MPAASHAVTNAGTIDGAGSESRAERVTKRKPVMRGRKLSGN